MVNKEMTTITDNIVYIKLRKERGINTTPMEERE